VLYEMLTGDPPHTGSTAQQIIMKIVTEEPQPVTKLRKAVPPNVAAATAKALEKLPADRFDSAAKFAEALHDPHFTSTPSEIGLTSAHSPLRANARASIGWAVAAVLALVLGWVVLRPTPTVVAPIPTRLTLDMIDFDGLRLGEIAVSPDGSLFALPDYEGIYIRPASDASFHLLPDTRLAIDPAFSPDSKWLVFVREGVLFKIPVDGGSPSMLFRSNQIIASNPQWGRTGTIVFQSGDRLYQVSGAGGEPELLGRGIFGRHPSLLPDGSGVLYTAPEGVMLFELGADTAQLIVPQGTDAMYVETGHVAYGHVEEGGLFVVPFDLRSRTITGPPVPVADDVPIIGTNAYYSISQTGTLLYSTDPLLMSVEGARQLLLLDLGGHIDTIPLSPRSFNWPRFSPDGRQLSFNTGTGRIEQRMIYTYDLVTGTTTQITSEGGTHAAAWSPDGTRFVFSSEKDGTIAEDLFIMPIDGSSPATQILSFPSDEHAMAWPTEDRIVFGTGGNADLMIVNPSNPTLGATPYLNAEWSETELSVSPNGEFAAYESDESGRPEIYVRRFPSAQDRRLVSVSGGRAPRWAPDGRTVYYWSLTQDTLFAARLQADPRPVGSPEVLAVIPRLIPGWDVDRVTGRAVVTQVVEANVATAPKLVVIVNWFETLKAKVGN
ncbi:MAG: hypothetical protein R3282_03255, partial [Rhodothermales bacterium]|nr:hypothetical protein [Rhodothermales bacterium]